MLYLVGFLATVYIGLLIAMPFILKPRPLNIPEDLQD
jgi:hypothetical protein